MKIVFATNNEHKLSEIRAILGSQFEIVSRSINGKTLSISQTYDSHSNQTYGDYKISSNPLVYNGKNQYPSFDISNDKDLINPSSD